MLSNVIRECLNREMLLGRSPIGGTIKSGSGIGGYTDRKVLLRILFFLTKKYGCCGRFALIASC